MYPYKLLLLLQWKLNNITGFSLTRVDTLVVNFSGEVVSNVISDEIYCSDGVRVKIKDLIEIIENCAALKAKPKLFSSLALGNVPVSCIV